VFGLLVYAIPKLKRPTDALVFYKDKKGIERSAPMHPKIFVAYEYIAILALVPVLWGIFLTLVFAVGWKNPFEYVSNWYGISAPGWLFDIIYARANDQPNGAHLWSWLSCAAFGIAVWIKSVPRPVKNFRDVIGDPFEGIAALCFIGGIHELIWVGFYYSVYWEYVTWSTILEFLRDISFAIMMGLFIITYWKYPFRKFPLANLKPVVIVFVIFLCFWLVVPALFGYHPMPVTTVNNTNLGQGIYQETPWFTLWWVNALETFSWLILCVPSIILVARWKPKRQIS
jgi:hypothetical protein